MIKPAHRHAVLALALAVASVGVFAQKSTKAAAAAPTAPWPTRPLKILVGFPGGSTPDLVARTIAEPLSKAIGQPVIVENKPGAGGNIAADQVAKATDNHTIGVMINGNMTIAKILNPATPFDPLKDLTPISLIGTAPLLLTAPANAPGNNAQEFFLAARN
ncbi:MAG: tripartite tricarboxylate transporter substrate-binding protein, partial [Ramlibacter sp.]